MKNARLHHGPMLCSQNKGDVKRQLICTSVSLLNCLIQAPGEHSKRDKIFTLVAKKACKC